LYKDRLKWRIRLDKLLCTLLPSGNCVFKLGAEWMYVHCTSAVTPRDPSPYTEIDGVPLLVLMQWKVVGCRRKVACVLWIFEKLECWSIFDVYWNNLSNGYVNMWGNECFRILSIDICDLCNWPRYRSYGFFVTIRTVVWLAKGLVVVSHALVCGLEVSWNIIYLVISVNWNRYAYAEV